MGAHQHPDRRQLDEHPRVQRVRDEQQRAARSDRNEGCGRDQPHIGEATTHPDPREILLVAHMAVVEQQRRQIEQTRDPDRNSGDVKKF